MAAGGNQPGKSGACQHGESVMAAALAYASASASRRRNGDAVARKRRRRVKNGGKSKWHGIGEVAA